MTADQLRQLHQRRPFEPLRLHLADGRSLAVDHPEFLAFAGGRTVFLGMPDELFHILDVLMITGVEIVNGKESDSGDASA
jgi:hypothetical protein